jgi:alpha-L-rhamnosidase
VLFVLVPLFLAGGGASVADLRCEYARDPLGLDVARPRLSWVIESERRGERQTAYRVLVAGSEEALAADRGDLWDSGEVRSDQSVHVEYVGKPLASRQRAFWKVRVWDREAQPSAWSPTARWEMGLLAPTDWVASWIGLPEGAGTSRLVADSPPATYLRKDFTLDRTVRCARAYASAKGLYVLSLNGRRVSEDVFRPGWTDYRDRIEYQTYDVTALVRRGANAVGVVLGDGWYAGHVGNWGRENWGRATRAAVQIEFEYADGTATRVVTDGSWKACTGARSSPRTS